VSRQAWSWSERSACTPIGASVRHDPEADRKTPEIDTERAHNADSDGQTPQSEPKRAHNADSDGQTPQSEPERAHYSPHAGAKRKRATQTAAPATRRAVLRRGSACAVPGCRNHRYLHILHVKPRSEGGDHDRALLTQLCHRHHTAVHAGALVISGNADSGFSFRHADGAPYGQPLDPSAVDTATKAFDALRGLGFKMAHARQLIDMVQLAGAPETLAAFVQAALRAS
jgi:hypothetical protein